MTVNDQEIRLKVTLRLEGGDGKRCFGPGVAALLEEVREQQSLRAAAANMGMAYSKAWRIIRTAEEAFGCKLLESTIGGRHGGGAVLTETAHALLAAYRTCQAEVNAFAQERFDARFAFLQEE